MDKQGWLDYLSSRTKSQIALEAVGKAQNWALALLGFMALGFGLSALDGNHPSKFILSTKILFSHEEISFLVGAKSIEM